MSNNSSLPLLLKSTARLYRRVTVEAVGSWLRGSRYVPLQLAVLFVVTAAVQLTGFGSSFGGNLLLSLLFSFLVAGYLGMIEASIRGEKHSPQESLQRAQQLFSPTLSVFFAFWVLSFIASHLLARPDQQWMLLAFSMVLTVLFNVAPEAIYSTRGMASPLAVSFEFMSENFVEWSIPWGILLGIIWLCFGQSVAIMGLLTLISTNPLHVPRMLMGFGGVLFNFGSSFAAVLLFIAALLLINFLLVWRGILFRELAQSTRRKRIYEERVRG